MAETLPDIGDDDVASSGFAIQSYTVHAISAATLRARDCEDGCNSAD